MNPTFSELVAYIEARGLEVERRMFFEGDPAGSYEDALMNQSGTRQLAKPRILIHNNRTDALGVVQAPVEPGDTICLAHEWGHYRRVETGERVSAYATFIKKVNMKDWPSSPLADRERVLEEETGAWEHGKALLASLGFEDWSAFERERVAGLEIYRVKLDLPKAA